MKSKFLILLISLLVSVSCLDYLEQPADVAGLSEDIVFSTIEDAEKDISRCYRHALLLCCYAGKRTLELLVF